MAESEDRKNYREDEIDAQYIRRLDPYNLSGKEEDAAKQADRNREFETKQYGATHDGSSTAQINAREEAALTSGLYTGSGKREQNETASLKTILKKKGPLAALITLGLGLPTILTMLLSPALLIQQLAETMTSEFNDQLAALDMRSTHLLKKKLNSTITKNVCGKKVTIKCKYQSIRKNSGLAKRLDRAGVKIIGDDSIIPGRTKPTHFEFQGNRIQAKDLLNEARKNPALRSALRKGYDPVYAAFADKISTKVRDKVGLKRSSSVKSSADQKKMNDDLKKVASTGEDLPTKKLKGPLTDSEGETYYEDDEGKRYDNKDGPRINGLVDEINERNRMAGSVKKLALKSRIKSALTATSLGFGAADTLCTAWVVLRVASFAAKVYQQRQLIRYSYEFMKIAHKQKYGDLKAEEMEFFGNKLATMNSEGKGALDSSGYKFAAYNDVFKPGEFNAKQVSDEKSQESEEEANKIMLKNETSRYINGQLLNDNIMSKLVGLISSGNKTVKGADKVCGFVKSWKGQAILIGAAILGLFLTPFSGGSSLGLSALASVSAAAAVSVAFALIQPKLLDMLKGEVINGDENGNETGNAIASGMGGYNAHTAPGSGLGVAPQSVYKEYAQLTDQVLAKNAEIDRSERSPFDASSKNTFLGSIVGSLIPYTTKMSTVGSASLATSSFISSAFSSVGTKQVAYAATEDGKYNKCEDNEYKGLAADPYCNLRYAIPKADLKIDPDAVVDFMLSEFHYEKDSKGDWIMDPETPSERKKFYDWIVSPSDATPKEGGEYEGYIKRCFYREDSIGDPYSKQGDGYECAIGGGGKYEYRNKMFRDFFIDQRGFDGMDEDFEYEGVEGGGTLPTGSGEAFTVGTYNILQADSHAAKSVSTAGGCDQSVDPQCVDKRTSYQADIILGNDKYNQIDIFGTQETSIRQYRKLLEKLPGYKGVPSNENGIKNISNSKNGNLSIIWNTAKFAKIEEGTVDAISNVANTQNKGHITAPWVGLQDSAGNKVYAISVHWPTSSLADPSLGDVGTQKKAVGKLMSWVNDKSTSGTVLVMGDFNDKPPQKTTYCGITASGLMQNAYDMAKNENASKPCPNANTDFGIDHIYASAKVGLIARKYQKLSKTSSDAIRHGSDHVPVTVELAFPSEDGSGSSKNAGDVAWPLDKKWWIRDKSDWLGPHVNSNGTPLSTGTSWGTSSGAGDNMGTSNKGTDIATDIGDPTDGSPVFAMVGGTVTSTNLCGSNDGIAIKTIVGGKVLGISYMHGTGQKFKVGDIVKAGDHIMNLGAIGCNVSGGHVHIGIAYDGKYICPQDVFIALDKREGVDWAALTNKGIATCGR